MTHPFHALSGRQLVCIGERYNRYGTRLLLRVDEDHVCSVPRQWTDVVPPDPEVVIGEGRALVRVADLLELADLVSRLVALKRGPLNRKANNAATVKETVPRADRRGRVSAIIKQIRRKGAAQSLDKGIRSGVIVDTNSEIACQRSGGRKDPKTTALGEEGTLNPSPEKVRDPKFRTASSSTRAISCR